MKTRVLLLLVSLAAVLVVLEGCGTRLVDPHSIAHAKGSADVMDQVVTFGIMCRRSSAVIDVYGRVWPRRAWASGCSRHGAP